MSASLERPLRIAMVGQRGVPATFGGIEHHVENVGARLAARGHLVTVYCRTNYGTERPASYRGMTLRHLPTAGTKHLDAITHSAVSTAVAMSAHHDVVHYHALGPGLFSPFPRFLSTARVVQTIHGLDDERAKWGPAAKAVLSTAGWLSARVPDATIAVSHALAEHYAGRGRAAVYIPNGVDRRTRRTADEITRRFGLTAGSYILFLGRLVPEKAPDLLIRAFGSLPGDCRLVIAGGSSFTDDYVQSLHDLAAADPRVLLTGYVYGEVLDELYSNAAAFVLPSALEGLPLTLLEAAAYGTSVVVSDIAPHLEVVGTEGPGHRVFPSGSAEGLADALRRSLAGGAAERAGAQVLQASVLAGYRWDDVATATEALYRRLVGRVATT
jgi:glycosyltransferase involved in cell wall biosynthesis